MTVSVETVRVAKSRIYQWTACHVIIIMISLMGYILKVDRLWNIITFCYFLNKFIAC